MVRCAGALVAVFVLSLGARAGAEVNEGPRFVWVQLPGAEACASEHELHTRLVTALGRDPFAGERALAVEGTVSREGAEFVARIELREAGKTNVERVLRTSADDCEPLTRATVLALSLSLEADRSSAPPRAPARSSSATRVRPELDRGVAQTSNAPVGPWSLSASVVWTLGVLPRASAGFGVEGRYAFAKRFAVLAGAAWLPEASREGQFAVGLVSAKLGGCVDLAKVGDLTMAGCAAGLVGALRVRDELGSTGDSGAHRWLAGEVTGNARARFAGPWLAELGAGGVLPWNRPTYATQSCPLVGFQQPVMMLALHLSAGVLF